jgi:hypothetical protein
LVTDIVCFRLPSSMDSSDRFGTRFGSEHESCVPPFAAYQAQQFSYSTPVRKSFPFDHASPPTLPHFLDPAGRLYFRQPIPQTLAIAAVGNPSEVDKPEISKAYDEYALQQEDSFFGAWSALMSHLPFSTLTQADSEATKLARQTNRDRANYLLCVLSTCLQAQPWEQVVFPQTDLFRELIIPYAGDIEKDVDRTLVGLLQPPSGTDVQRIYVPPAGMNDRLETPLFNPSTSSPPGLPAPVVDKLVPSSALRRRSSSPCRASGQPLRELSLPECTGTDSTGLSGTNDPDDESHHATADRSHHACQDQARRLSHTPPIPDVARASKRARVDEPFTPSHTSAADGAPAENGSDSRSPAASTLDLIRRMPNAGVCLTKTGRTANKAGRVRPSSSSRTHQTSNRDGERNEGERVLGSCDINQRGVADRNLTPRPSGVRPTTQSGMRPRVSPIDRSGSPSGPPSANTDGKENSKRLGKDRFTPTQRCTAIYEWAEEDEVKPLGPLRIANTLYESIPAAQSRDEEDLALSRLLCGYERVSKEEWVGDF